jgi:hypothetical protein
VTKQNYPGSEQRKEVRRKQKDQRLEIRFEPEKDDRRKISGRRETDGNVWKSNEQN